MSGRGFFVTGTDTGVGKTLVAAALLLAGARAGLRTAGVKPVAAGCRQREGVWVNADALLLQRCATLRLPYAEVNPVALISPIAPHVAAAEQDLALDVAGLADAVERVAARAPELLIVEGAGGWLVPLSATQTMADLAVRLGLPVILVVGLRLGCLNHALLTAAAIDASGLPLAGWIANSLEPDMPAGEANRATLMARLPAPCLGTIPYLGEQPQPEQALGCIDLELGPD